MAKKKLKGFRLHENLIKGLNKSVEYHQDILQIPSFTETDAVEKALTIGLAQFLEKEKLHKAENKVSY